MGKPGRPRKNGAKDSWTLLRAAKVSHFYNQARRAGLKHSSAVTETVELIRQSNPEKSISATEVRRVLAEIQSKDSFEALLFERERLKGAEAANERKRLAYLTGEAERLKAAMQKSSCGDTREVVLPAALTGDGPLDRYAIRISRRPSYARHNAKDPSKRR